VIDPATRIAIIGGGIGGLVCGLALRRVGLNPVIHERAGAFEDVGAGISLSPNAVKALNWLGLGDFLAATANEPQEQQLRHGRTGALLQAIDRRRTRDVYGAPYLQLHRADLVAALVAAFGADRVQLGQGLDRIAPDGQLGFADGSQASADLVIGADGLRSMVRAQLFETRAPQFSGHVAWRALVPAAALPAEASAAVNINHLGQGRNIVCYPVRGGALVNVVALTESASWAEESWSARAETAELAAHFAGWAPFVQQLIAALPEDQLFRWGLFIREPLERWVSGCTALLGDAAHPMLPYMGQGASCSIEDGVVLARALAAADDVEGALARYQAARRPRAGFLQAQSNLGGARLHAIDPDAFQPMDLKDEDALGIFRYDPVAAEV
jgi:salicylate hydroxylase